MISRREKQELLEKIKELYNVDCKSKIISIPVSQESQARNTPELIQLITNSNYMLQLTIEI